METVDVKNTLQKLIDRVVTKDRYVKNAVLSISAGDGKFKWSVASGMADPDEKRIMTADTPIFIASITKMFTATTVMRLFENNDLKLTDPMSAYLPPSLINGIHVYNGKDFTDQITIRHLLNHTSGIPDYYTGKPKEGPDFGELLFSEPDKGWTPEETVAFARNRLSPAFLPGEKASYSDTNYQILGFIIESVTGQPLHEVFKDMILEPLEMKHTYLYQRSVAIDPDIKEPAHLYSKDTDMTFLRGLESSWADGGVVSTMEDCLRFIKAFNTGKLFLNESTQPMMREWVKMEKGMYYGFGTMRFVLPEVFFLLFRYPTLVGHSGSTGSFLYYCEKPDFYLAGTVNQTTYQQKHFRIILKVINIIRKFQKENR